jgi:hypothetical protein
MSIPRACVRDIDRARAIRAILGFRGSDPLAVEHVAREAAAYSDPESVAHLVLALTESAASFLEGTPDADERLRRILLDFAHLEANQD